MTRVISDHGINSGPWILIISSTHGAASIYLLNQLCGARCEYQHGGIYRANQRRFVCFLYGLLTRMGKRQLSLACDSDDKSGLFMMILYVSTCKLLVYYINIQTCIQYWERNVIEINRQTSVFNKDPHWLVTTRLVCTLDTRDSKLYGKIYASIRTSVFTLFAMYLLREGEIK